MKQEIGFRAVLAGFAAALLMSSAAAATPTTYIVNGVAADITVTLNGVGIGGSVASIPINGQQFTFDFAIPEVVDFAIEAAGGLIQLTVPVDVGLGAFDQIIVTSAVLTSVATASYPAIGGGAIFNFNGMSGGGPVGIATSDLVLSNGGGPGVPVNGFISPASSISGTIFADAGVIEAAIIGFTLFDFTTVTGEHLQAKADILVTGTAVPEPSAAFLYGCAVLMIGVRVRSAGRHSS